MNEAGANTSPEAQLRAWVDYLRDLGIHEFYRGDGGEAGWTLSAEHRERLLQRATATGATRAAAPVSARPSVSSSPAARRPPTAPNPAAPSSDWQVFSRDPSPRPSGPIPPRTESARAAELPPELAAPMPRPDPIDSLLPHAIETLPVLQRPAALEALREHIGDCTRCPLAYAGRRTIVFGEGDPGARLMFVGEGPGADEDASGRPFVGKAGQLLNNMITAMGLDREQVYIANVVKCRPPANRTPEFVEATTCSPFLAQQLDIVRPEVVVALGGTAATYLLGVRQSLASMRGQWFQARGAKVVVTYHPAFLLRDPRQKAEAWKDLQRVMVELGLKPKPKA